MWENNALSEDCQGLKQRNALSHNLLKLDKEKEYSYG